MRRRTSAVSGWVNFPIEDPAWKCSKEGGMVVKLVVCDTREFDDQFGVCCGGLGCRPVERVFHRRRSAP